MTAVIDTEQPQQLVFCSFCPNTNAEAYIFCGERGNICEACVDTIIVIKKMRDAKVKSFKGTITKHEIIKK